MYAAVLARRISSAAVAGGGLVRRRDCDDADARGQAAQRCAAVRDLQRVDRGEHAGGDVLGGGKIGVREEREEFFAGIAARERAVVV